MGFWGMRANVDVVEEERRLAGFIHPTTNLAESENARFWNQVGGKKGGYLTPIEVVKVQARHAVMQIAKRAEFERRGWTGRGPGRGELEMRAETRKRTFDRVREKRDEVFDEEEERGTQEKARRPRTSLGIGLGGPVSTVRKGIEAGGGLSERSTHRHDRMRVDSYPTGFEYRGAGRLSVDLNEAPALHLSEMTEEELERQKRRYEDLAAEARGANRGGREEERREGSAGEWLREESGGREREEEEKEAERGESRREGGENIERESEEAVPLKGEERYNCTEWVIARLDVDDNAGCIGKVTEKEACTVTAFAEHAVSSNLGPLVFLK